MIITYETPLSESAINLNNRDGFVLDVDVLANTTATHQIDVTRHSKISIVARLHANASLFILIIGDVESECVIDRSIELIGDGASVSLISLLRTKGASQCDISDDVHILSSKTKCIIDNRVVSEDSSRAVVRERVVVNQSVNSGEVSTSIRGMMMGDASSIRAIPELDIASNFVTAKHAVSIARPSESMVSYCATRGMTKAESMTMIADGLLCPITSTSVTSVIAQSL